MVTPAAEFRDRVDAIRETKVGDGYGNTRSGAWTVFAKGIAAKVSPLKGGEIVKAGRLAEESNFEVTVRGYSQTRAILPTDRLRNARTGVVYDIKHIADLTGDGREFLFTCRVTR